MALLPDRRLPSRRGTIQQLMGQSCSVTELLRLGLLSNGFCERWRGHQKTNSAVLLVCVCIELGNVLTQ
ncbi:uncharacterized protein PHACADRAFT_262667 [Phanerochaete carnosa HHB-10118-sp]|uniref:Uncharacterized protein n=1 Tax=Phanerochaete carnosa (strain HHB-10118-sp) TaxID=650164 RepID=K5VZ93_PHACS|nr:uncharacterized protein PHACADRAFT_262667 [Phanerochaete carnosa HHB-10118-sp]EKM52160.1 hypothetical protein PHACADRAFT_262667 [Phanerochaete carnosa HHB-10118-sp]